MVLFDTSTGTSQVLYSKTNTDKKSFDILPIQVNGNYAVWQQVVSDAHGRVLGGDVWRYDIAAGTTTKIPNAEGVWQYGPSVNSAGTVFFGRSNLHCGKNAQLIERKLDGNREFPCSTRSHTAKTSASRVRSTTSMGRRTCTSTRAAAVEQTSAISGGLRGVSQYRHELSLCVSTKHGQCRDARQAGHSAVGSLGARLLDPRARHPSAPHRVPYTGSSSPTTTEPARPQVLGRFSVVDVSARTRDRCATSPRPMPSTSPRAYR